MASCGKLTIGGQTRSVDEKKMDTVSIYDKGGNPLRMQLVDGVLFNRFYDPDILRAVKQYKLRNSDIYLVGYQRTGGNWTYERLGMLLRGSSETIQRERTIDMVEVTSSEDMDRIQSPRIICAHLPLSDGPEQLAEKKCKIVFTLRDPKDAAVSYYHLYKDLPHVAYQGAFKDFLYLYMDGKAGNKGIFVHMRDAEDYIRDHPDIPVYIQLYEDVVKNPVKATQELSDFLILPRDDDLCRAIAEECEIEKMKAKKKNVFKVDGRSVLMRKGVVGDWRNYFTEEMLEDYYRVYEEKMAGSRFYNLYSKDNDMQRK